MCGSVSRNVDSSMMPEPHTVLHSEVSCLRIFPCRLVSMPKSRDGGGRCLVVAVFLVSRWRRRRARQLGGCGRLRAPGTEEAMKRKRSHPGRGLTWSIISEGR
jgi:hypothetical protein